MADHPRSAEWHERFVTEADVEDGDVEFLNAVDQQYDDDHYDPPCCPAGSENKWNPATWCGCQH
jgi:hypothetical protein